MCPHRLVPLIDDSPPRGCGDDDPSAAVDPSVLALRLFLKGPWVVSAIAVGALRALRNGGPFSGFGAPFFCALAAGPDSPKLSCSLAIAASSSSVTSSLLGVRFRRRRWRGGCTATAWGDIAPTKLGSNHEDGIDGQLLAMYTETKMALQLGSDYSIRYVHALPHVYS